MTGNQVDIAITALVIACALALAAFWMYLDHIQTMASIAAGCLA